jgi:hypothetical protein
MGCGPPGRLEVALDPVDQYIDAGLRSLRLWGAIPVPDQVHGKHVVMRFE